MTPDELWKFKVSVRLDLIERLLLQRSLIAPVMARQLTVDESRMALVEWLESPLQGIEEGFGKKLGDSALTALYSETMRELIDDMKATIDKTAESLSQTIARHRT